MLALARGDTWAASNRSSKRLSTLSMQYATTSTTLHFQREVLEDPMGISIRKTAVAATAALALLTACSAGTNTTSSTTPQASTGGSAPAASAAASPVASIPDDQLAFAGKLVICSDIPYPPQEFFDDAGNPVGSDIEIGQEIAKRLGLEPQIENSVFDTIIAAVNSGKCDIIISAQNITADRVKAVDMIPYFQAGQSFVVAKGNPKAIKVEDDLCGKLIAAETGTTEIDYLKGTGDYAGMGLSAACESKGKAAIDIKEYPKDSDALAALTSGNVDAYFADSPVAGYYTVQNSAQFELSGLTLDVAKEGISVPKEHTETSDAVVAALKSMMDDGSYEAILDKYGVQDGALQATDVVPVTK
jgi:polar amino acid transport system substrate-binding protein